MTTIQTDESQNIEFKESWYDKYLQWICGFANAQGGRIYIGVTDNMLQIVNGGVLPDGWTVDTLLSSHRSMPYNPDIANTFFRAGEVEAWVGALSASSRAAMKTVSQRWISATMPADFGLHSGINILPG